MDSVQVVFHLVGEQTIPIFLSALQFDSTVRHVLISTVTHKTKLACKNLENELKRNGFSAETMLFGGEKDANDFREINRQIGSFIEVCNPAHAPAAFDITGGTKPMALIAFKLCSQYPEMHGYYVDFNNRSLVWLHNLEVVPLLPKMKVENFIHLAGMEAEKVQKPTPQEEEFSRFVASHAANAVVRVQEKFAGLEKIQGGKVGDLFASHYAELSSLICPEQRSQWDVLYENWGKNLSPSKKAFFFAGGWLETFLFSLLSQANETGIVEIWQNARLRWPENGKTAQELDIAYTDGFSLVILECKAGSIKQDHIQKLENLRDAFAGSLGKCALVTLVSAYTKNNQKVSFAERISTSKRIAAFCGINAIRNLPAKAFSFASGNVYEK